MTTPLLPSLSAEDMATNLNANLDGWSKAMSMRFVRASADEVVAELEIGPPHRQTYGIVHGGVHAGLIETATSIGAALYASRHGQPVVGLENHTSFLKAVREGTLRVIARPLARGRSTQVWEATVIDAAERPIASGRVRLFALEAGSVAGPRGS